MKSLEKLRRWWHYMGRDLTPSRLFPLFFLALRTWWRDEHETVTKEGYQVVCKFKGTRYRNPVRVLWDAKNFTWRVDTRMGWYFNNLYYPYQWYEGWQLTALVPGYEFDHLVNAVVDIRSDRFVRYLGKKNRQLSHGQCKGFAHRVIKPWTIHDLHPHWLRLVKQSGDPRAEVSYWLFREFGRIPISDLKAVVPALPFLKEARYWRYAVASAEENWSTFWHLQSRSFRKSIMWMPKIAINLVPYINNFVRNVPPRAPFGRSKHYWCLIAVLGYAFGYDWMNDWHKKVETIYELLLRTDEKALIKLVPKTRKSSEIFAYFRNWLDAPLPEKIPSNATLVWYAEQQRNWHGLQDRWQVRQSTDPALFQKPVAVPPIPLPKNVQFLDTVDAILTEGERMGHCVGTYYQKALSGYCYLFHYEDKGQMATAEVSPQGQVVQSFGPYDHITPTSKKLASILNRWGKKLPKTAVAILPAMPQVEIPF